MATPTPSAEAPRARRFGMIESFPLHRLRCHSLLSQAKSLRSRTKPNYLIISFR